MSNRPTFRFSYFQEHNYSKHILFLQTSMSSSRLVKTLKGQVYWRTLIRLKDLDVSFPNKRLISTHLPDETTLGGFYFYSSILKNNKIVPHYHLSVPYRNFVANDNSEAGRGNNNDSTSEPPGRNWKRWVIGILISVIIPSFTHKLGPGGVWKDEFDTRVQEIEDAVEEGEQVARAVEKVAEKWIDSLPDGLLKDALTIMEKGAERASNLFNEVDNVIDQFQEEEEKIVENWIESAKGRIKVPKEEIKEIDT